MKIRTVAELIVALQALPQDAYVVVQEGGDDGGWTEPSPELCTGRLLRRWSSSPATFSVEHGFTEGDPGVVMGVIL